jgi:hypothetical protein
MNLKTSLSIWKKITGWTKIGLRQERETGIKASKFMAMSNEKPPQRKVKVVRRRPDGRIERLNNIHVRRKPHHKTDPIREDTRKRANDVLTPKPELVEQPYIPELGFSNTGEAWNGVDMCRPLNRAIKTTKVRIKQ